ncbi:UDP-N-acetylmuramate--L-alanine ligase [Oculatella sp. LEGE 06141]|uniref:UDP-N-acetylmuramate--L-alanine ligase n=1 Tax=Oculatella sp. LEGE 06141 TaxID=1828648 RepID=UPI00187EEA44|nr:UDP-N-acetylmuramate--L-alanine ligase [Oculatella sp. LEGE 06141]MBE9181305.1 UDP-N-acetylmuramate--L-alanine ligase [Oculatella sp. LEGE 06141]
MLNSVDFSGRPFHFIGIGGIGMSALAYVLAKRKLPVSGSDLRLSHITQRLQEEGAHIFWQQEASNLQFFQAESGTSPNSVSSEVNGHSALLMEPYVRQQGQVLETLEPELLPQVICSTAINSSNSEYLAALQLGCPIFHRSDVLAALIQEYQSIAVAGTHGKTTTSSLIGYLLMQAGLDPTIVVGGEVNAWGGNARVGNSPYLVAEADESDGSLVKLAARIGIVTNMELDHPDHYATLDQVIETFKVFAQNCQTLIGCIDDETVRQALNPTITYSLQRNQDADYTVDHVVYGHSGTTATVIEHGKPLGQLQLKLLGQHNLSNALAAIAVGRLLGLEFDCMAPIIATFEGARRRFERRGEPHQILFVDDYAHHPSEVQATLSAARLQAGAATRRRVVAIFQPHRYSRIMTFLDDFAQSFGHADLVITTDVYSAGESPIGAVSGQQVADAIAAYHPQVVYQPTLPDVTAYLQDILQPGDIALFLGAGNLNGIIPELLGFYQQLDQDEPETRHY